MSDPKKRHGCLTAFLLFLIVLNIGAISIWLFAIDIIKQQIPDIPSWAAVVIVALSLFDIVCAIALMNWEKWGFWGLLISNTILYIVHLSIGTGIVKSLGVFILITILYGVLHIGKNNKGWPQFD